MGWTGIVAAVLVFALGIVGRTRRRRRRPQPPVDDRAPKAAGAAVGAPAAPYIFDETVFALEQRIIAARRSAAEQGDPKPHSPQETVGLALSGGGIRSATFSLGVLQALARKGMLSAIDYVSTVSGGGYAGCFLGSFFLPQALRQNPDATPSANAFKSQAKAAYKAFRDAADPPAPSPGTAGVRSALVKGNDPGPKPGAGAATTTGWQPSMAFEWLRNNGRYLAPRGTGDLIYVLAMQIRNWAAVQYVVALVIVTCEMLFATTRTWLIAESALWRKVEVLFQPETGALIYWSPGWALVGVLAVVTILPPALAYWVAHARVDRKDELTWIPLWHEGAIIFLLLLGLCWAFTVLVVEVPGPHLHPPAELPNAFWAALGYVLLALTAIMTFLAGLLLERKGTDVFRDLVAAIVAALLLAGLAWRFRQTGAARPLVVVSVALLVFAVWYVAWKPSWQLNVKSLRTRYTRWLRWMFQLTLSSAGLAVLGTIGQTAYAYLHRQAPGAGTIAGIVSVIAALVTGARQLFKWMGAGTKTPHRKIPLTGLAAAAALILLLLTGSAWAVVVQTALWNGGPPPAVPDSVITGHPRSWTHHHYVLVSSWGPAPRVVPLDSATAQAGVAAFAPATHQDAAEHPPVSMTTGWMSVLLAGVCFLFLTTGSFLNFLNMSSLHQFYAARLTRAYLGATNRARFLDGGVVAITSPLPTDAIPLRAYYHPGLAAPVHLINVTLNQTRPFEGQLVQRDRKGLSMAIGPAFTVVNSAVFQRGAKAKLSPANDDALVLARHRPLGPWTFLLWLLRRRVSTGELPPPAGIPDKQLTPEQASRWRPLVAEDLDLGDWCAISGAAFSTGMGMRTSLGLSLLAGLANVRLGYWWNFNSERIRAGILAAYRYLWSELMGDFRGPWRAFWFLTDGGHFDNTGVYELVRRRVGIILLCDNGADPDFGFDDLGNLARKIRTDFGANMEPCVPRGSTKTYFGQTSDFKAPADGDTSPRPQKCALLFRISYPGATPGTVSSDWTLLIVLKPHQLAEAPVDVLEYAAANPDFPHQSTLDQFFDDAQWESYRRMGDLTATVALEPAALRFDGWRAAG